MDREMPSEEIILCESIIDALTFWCAGYRNVTCSYGIEGFTADHLVAFRGSGIKRVLIAYDSDEAGDKAAQKLSARLMTEGFGCYRVQFPKGMDANEYARKVTPPTQSLGLVLRKARWLGSGKPPKDGPALGPVAVPNEPPAPNPLAAAKHRAEN